MANLLESLQGYITPDLITRTSNQLGETEANTAKAFGGTMPTVLAGLVNKTDEPGGLGAVYDLISQHKGGTEANLASAVPGTPGGTSPDSGPFISGVFGGKTDLIQNELSKYAGVKTSSISALLGFIAPMIMGFLGKKTRDENLDAAGLGTYLNSEKSSIMNALPAGLGSVMGLSGAPAPVPLNTAKPVTPTPPPVERRVPPVEQHTPVPPKKMNWLWPLLVVVGAVLLLLFALRSCNKDKEVVTTETTETEEVIMPDTIAETEMTTTRVFNKKALPGGVELNIPDDGIESQMVAFIEDKDKKVDKTTWFTFDRLTFETGSARILPASDEQLKNIAEIMKAYPKVEIKIGGYTDNVGKPADNMKLSQSRAANVKDALVKMGIATKRMDAEGYGEQHPVAENTTEEGRAKNRRIDVRVTKK